MSLPASACTWYGSFMSCADMCTSDAAACSGVTACKTAAVWACKVYLSRHLTIVLVVFDSSCQEHSLSTLTILHLCRSPLFAGIAQNGVNLSLDLLLVFGAGWGVVGVSAGEQEQIAACGRRMPHRLACGSHWAAVDPEL